MLKTLVTIAGALAALPVVYLGSVAFAAAHQAYDWRHMDWNEDGRTTAREFLASAEIGRRSGCGDGGRCTEFYSLKDGLPVRIVCD